MAASESSQKDGNDALLDVRVQMFKVESKAIKQKQNIEELEQKMNSKAKELDAFRAEMRGLVEQQKASEQIASKFKQGLQTVYYGPTALGHKNPTSNSHATAANVLPLPSQLHDPPRIHSTDATVTSAEVKSSVKHADAQDTLSGRSAARISLPENIRISKEFAELQSCYIDIVTSMPHNYLETVQLLESHLCNQHISDIFECSSALDANQTVVKCLIEKATCKPDVLDFCETLLHLKNASQLVCTVEKLRKTIIENLQGSPNVNEPPTLPEVTTGSTVGEEDGTSINEGAEGTSQASNVTSQAKESLQKKNATLPSADQDQDTDDDDDDDDQLEQVAAASQAYLDLVNGMVTGNSEVQPSELLSESAKFLKQMGPVMENMGDMLSTLTSSGDEQNEDTGDSSGDQSQQATNVMTQSLLSQMGMGWLSAFTNPTNNSATGKTSGNQSQQAAGDPSQQGANIMSQYMELLNQMVVGGTSSDQTQQAAAANIMSGSMKLLSLMGMGSQPSASNATEHSDLPTSQSVKPVNTQGSYVYTKEDQVAALASFDSHHDLLILIDPNPLEEQLVQLKFFPSQEQVSSNNQTAGRSNMQMEALLNNVRSIIVRKGAVKFIELVEIIRQKKPCDELAAHMIGCYMSNGAHTIPEELKNLVTSLSRAELTRVMQHHQSH